MTLSSFRTEVKATFVCVDSSQESIGVEGLETKVFTYDNALLRTSDMKSFDVLCDFIPTSKEG